MNTEPKRALAQSYATQSRRLQHVANRLRVMMKMDRCRPQVMSRASRKTASQHSPCHQPQSWKHLDDLSKKTLATKTVTPATAPIGNTNVMLGLQSVTGSYGIQVVPLVDAPEGGTCHP